MCIRDRPGSGDARREGRTVAGGGHELLGAAVALRLRGPHHHEFAGRPRGHLGPDAPEAPGR
eukprot:6076960-Alexandrium_andersonii.AAC.1